MYRLGDQKRKSFRAEVKWPVTVESSRETLEAETKDISAAGANIRCPKSLPPEKKVRLTIRAPGREPIKVAATVVWSEQPASQAGLLGLRFDEVSAKDRHFLEQLSLQQFQARLGSS